MTDITPRAHSRAYSSHGRPANHQTVLQDFIADYLRVVCKCVCVWVEEGLLQDKQLAASHIAVTVMQFQECQ